MIDYVLLNLVISQFSLIFLVINQPLWNVVHGYQINFGLSVVRSVSTDMCNLWGRCMFYIYPTIALGFNVDVALAWAIYYLVSNWTFFVKI